MPEGGWSAVTPDPKQVLDLRTLSSLEDKWPPKCRRKEPCQRPLRKPVRRAGQSTGSLVKRVTQQQHKGLGTQGHMGRPMAPGWSPGGKAT